MSKNKYEKVYIIMIRFLKFLNMAYTNMTDTRIASKSTFTSQKDVKDGTY